LGAEGQKRIKPISILLDEPVGQKDDARAELGFEEYADVLAGVILGSDSPFTVGIFGDWGTGKTTLMRCIERKLNSPEQWQIDDPKPTIIPVWFEAWRYEREDDLIAPLLGEIGDAINARRERLDAAWQEVARLTTSLASSLSLKATLPFFEIGFDSGKFADKYEEVRECLPSSSVYRDAYRALKSTLQRLAEEGSQQNKIVVFVDDLDRCLPEPAVEVLEATKVFLGFAGMVFVLGLKRDVIENCIKRRYCRSKDGQTELPYDLELGTKYIDKLVQVPFSIPDGGPEQMSDFVAWLAKRGDFPSELTEDYQPMVPSDEWQHDKLYAAFDEAHQSADDAESRYGLVIEHLAPVPRTLKRAINAYSVAAHIAAGSIDAGDFDPDLMIALVVLQFLAPDVYRELTSQPKRARSRLFARAAMALDLESDLPRHFTDTINHGPFPIRDSAEKEIPDAEAVNDPRAALRRRWGMPIAYAAARFLLHTRLLEAEPEAVARHARVAAAVSSPDQHDSGFQHVVLSKAMLRNPSALAELLNEEREAGLVADALVSEGVAVVPYVAEVLATGEDDAPRWAAEILGRIGDEVSILFLLDALGHHDHGVRASAVTALGRIGPAAGAALPSIIELQRSDVSRDVRRAVTGAIRSIVPSGPPPPPF
jgi:hypothetical protein